MFTSTKDGTTQHKTNKTKIRLIVVVVVVVVVVIVVVVVVVIVVVVIRLQQFLAFPTTYNENDKS